MWCRYEDALGVRSHAWSPRGTFLCIGSFDGIVRTLDNASWSVVATANAETLSASISSTADGEDGVGSSTLAELESIGGAVAAATAVAADEGASRPSLFEEVYDHELPDVQGAKGAYVSIVSDGTTANGAHIVDPDDPNNVSQARTIMSSCMVCVPRLSSVAWRDLGSDVLGAQASRTCSCAVH